MSSDVLQVIARLDALLLWFNEQSVEPVSSLLLARPASSWKGGKSIPRVVGHVQDPLWGIAVELWDVGCGMRDAGCGMWGGAVGSFKVLFRLLVPFPTAPFRAGPGGQLLQLSTVRGRAWDLSSLTATLGVYV